MKPRRKHRHDGDQVPNEFFFGREGFAVHNRDLGSMPFTKLLKPVIAKAHEPILIADNEPRYLSYFNLLDHLIEAFAFVVQRGASVFDPLIDFDPMFQAVGSQSFFLESQVFFLRGGRHTSIRDHQSLLGGNQPTILQVLFMRVVSPIRRTTKRR